MTNKKLEKLMENMKQQKMESLSEEMMDKLREEQLVLPAVLPQDITPEAMRQFIDNQGTNMPLPKGINPGACIIQNSAGESFIPLFTTIEEMNKGKNQFPLSLNVTFDAAVNMVQEGKGMAGIVINPFTHNLVLRFHREQTENQPQKTEEITVEQYHALARRQMEAVYLPSQLFEKKGALVQKLCDEKGRMLREMYEELYQEEIACPYTEDDFEFLTLNISETLLVSQITMPAKNRYPHLCYSVIYGFDREQDKIWYYAIVYEGRDNPPSLVQVTETGEPKNLGKAPAEGSELSGVLDLIQEKDG